MYVSIQVLGCATGYREKEGAWRLRLRAPTRIPNTGVETRESLMCPDPEGRGAVPGGGCACEKCVHAGREAGGRA